MSFTYLQKRVLDNRNQDRDEWQHRCLLNWWGYWGAIPMWIILKQTMGQWLLDRAVCNGLRLIMQESPKLFTTVFLEQNWPNLNWQKSPWRSEIRFDWKWRQNQCHYCYSWSNQKETVEVYSGFKGIWANTKVGFGGHS